MKVLILGGDGFLGWPTAMHLSSCGHEVTVIDNYFRRTASVKIKAPQLYPTPKLNERAAAWSAKSGKDIKVYEGDVTDYAFFLEAFREIEPDAVIHYAEQPSAPYSMANYEQARFTLNNNLTGTLNLAYAVREVNPECHIIKLGTMGEYGTPNIDIEEGFIDIEHKGRKGRFLFPRQAGSLYHTTKIQDTDLLYFYVRAWGLRVTDLMQGPVYGLFTDEMGDDENLYTCFSYDEAFGTALNRFVVQAVAGIPLTVYGAGGQTRGYLNIKDTMQCIRLAVDNPLEEGGLRVFNQFTETFSVNDLADRVVRAGKMLSLDVKVQSVENPRVEAEEHYYNPVLSALPDLGLEPNLLTDDVLAQILETVMKYKNNIREDSILPKTKWK